MNETIMSPESHTYRLFRQIVTQKHMVFLPGLPGTGKSLLLNQLGLMAQDAGRAVHLLQWDVTRSVFETAANLTKYPEVNGVTHAAIRKAVGLWTRDGVSRWAKSYGAPDHILLGEVPLVGNRLSELVEPLADEAEGILAGEQTLFVLPVPSRAVRQVIEAARATSVADPQHERERQDAQPNVLQLLWEEIARIGWELGLVEAEPTEDMAYDPAVYTVVYQHLLAHRHHEILPIDTVLRPIGSAYDLSINGTELAAAPDEVEEIMQGIELRYTAAELETAVANWYRVGKEKAVT